MTDDAYARTSFAWMRTILGSVAVTALVLRGLVVAGVPLWAIAAAAVPAAAFLIVGTGRVRTLRAHRRADEWRPGPAAVVTAIVGLVALVSIIGVASSG